MNRDQQQSSEYARSEKVDSFPEVMTLEEAARYLRLRELGTNNLKASLRRLIYERGLPAVRIGRGLVFPKAAIDEWLASEANAHAAGKNTGASNGSRYTGGWRSAGSPGRRTK
jgi:excisionase family DNA binding protein